jgi:hypothetical protein
MKSLLSRLTWEPEGNEMSADVEESPLLEARYQETTSGDCNRLRTLVCVR